jgi:uncharacterized protein
MKLLLWLGLAVLVYLALRKNFRSNIPPANRPSESARPDSNQWADEQFTSSANAKQAETMLSCAHCQVYFPASEAVLRGELNYCSVEHADAAAKSS